MNSSNRSDQAGTAAVGLRERSKARRRAAIQRTAMRLFAEHGYDNTSIADIAATAEVAIRTVAGYFPTKLDMAIAYGGELAERLNATFAERPGADVLEVFDVWLAGEAEHHDPEMAALAHAMYRANPALGALTRAHLGESFRVGGAAMRAHLGLPPDDPMATMGMAAFGAAIEIYLLDLMPQYGNSPQLHASMMAFLRQVLAAAKANSTNAS